MRTTRTATEAIQNDQLTVAYCDQCYKAILVDEPYCELVAQRMTVDSSKTEHAGIKRVLTVWCEQCAETRCGELIDEVDLNWDRHFSADPFAA